MNQNQQSKDLDVSDFEDWLKSPITAEIFSVLRANKEVLKENILSLDPVNDLHLDRKNAYLRGSLEMCEIILNITFDQLFLKEEEEKSESEKTPYSW